MACGLGVFRVCLYWHLVRAAGIQKGEEPINKGDVVESPG